MKRCEPVDGQSDSSPGHVAARRGGLLIFKVAPYHERYEPFLLPDYSISDFVRNEDMETATVDNVYELQIGDCAFIRRSNGTWSYAVVKSRLDGDHPSITFQAHSNVTKTVPIA